MTFRFRLIAFAAILAARPVLAQDKPVPPPRAFEPETRQPLRQPQPIQLPEYIILGSDRINVDADRSEHLDDVPASAFIGRLGIGARESVLGSVAPLRRPLVHESLPGDRYTVLARIGMGRYSTPIAEAWAQKDFRTADMTAHARFEQSDGHVVGADYSRFTFDATAGSHFPASSTPILARSRVQGFLSYDTYGYGLFGAPSLTESPAPSFDRRANAVRYGAELISRRNPVIDHRAVLTMQHFTLVETMTVNDSIPRRTFDRSEHRLGLNVHVSREIASHPVDAELNMAYTVQRSGLPGIHDPLFIRAAAQTTHVFHDDLLLEGALRLHLFRGTDGITHARIYPAALLRYSLDADYHVFALAEAAVRERTLRMLFEQNPYTAHWAGVRHDILPVHLQIGAGYDDRTLLAGRIMLDYSAIQSFAVYTRLAHPLSQMWDVAFDDVSISTLRADASWNITTSDRIAAQGALRTGRDEMQDAPIPYLPDFQVSGLYSHRFPFALTVTGTLELIGSRPGDPGRLPARLNIGVNAEIWPTEHIGAFATISNLFDQRGEFWDGYPERPMFFMIGLSGRW